MGKSEWMCKKILHQLWSVLQLIQLDTAFQVCCGFTNIFLWNFLPSSFSNMKCCYHLFVMCVYCRHRGWLMSIEFHTVTGAHSETTLQNLSDEPSLLQRNVFDWYFSNLPSGLYPPMIPQWNKSGCSRDGTREWSLQSRRSLQPRR